MSNLSGYGGSIRYREFTIEDLRQLQNEGRYSVYYCAGTGAVEYFLTDKVIEAYHRLYHDYNTPYRRISLMIERVIPGYNRQDYYKGGIDIPYKIEKKVNKKLLLV